METVDFFKEITLTHNGFFVDAIHSDSSLRVRYQEVNTSEFVHEHGHRNRLDAFADVQLFKTFGSIISQVIFFIIVYGFELKWETNWSLFCRSDAVKHNAVVVLVAHRHVGLSAG